MPRWDDSAKFRLLLAIIAIVNPGSLSWTEIADKMGPEFTAEAVRYVYIWTQN